MPLIILPEWTLSSVIFYAFMALFSLLAGPLNSYDLLGMRYSKFRTGQGITSRAGMFILYIVPMLAAILAALPYLGQASLIQWMLLGAVVLHFAKRCIEVLFVHRYAGLIDLLSVAMITSVYTFVAVGASLVHRQTIQAIDGLFMLGGVLFLVGQGINFYHHKLLADLRKPGALGDPKAYHIPQNGLFAYVSCPHYLGEIIAWLGLALMSRHLFLYLALIIMINYLASRSLKAQQWYRQQFPDYPADRKALLPFIF